MTEQIEPADLAARLCEDVEGVCRDIGLVGRRRGRSFVAHCPWNRRAEPKLYVDLRKAPGGWIDFTSGETGDILWLIALTMSGGIRSPQALGEALKWTRHRFGLSGGNYDRDAWQRSVERARRAAAEREAAAALELEKDRNRAHGRWLSGLRLLPHQDAWKYFLARGIDFERLGRKPGAVRFSPQEPYWEDGKIIYTGPALMTAMTLPDGSFGAVHKTYFDPARPGEKIDLGLDPHGEPRKPRKMWPQTLGCVMRLWRGGDGLSEKDATKHGLLEDVIVCEGVEDAYSLAMIDPKRRIWGAGSLGGLLNMTPPSCADALTIAADNDWGKPQAEAQLVRACRRFVDEFGLTVKIIRSPEGKDFNDLIRPRK